MGVGDVDKVLGAGIDWNWRRLNWEIIWDVLAILIPAARDVLRSPANINQ